MTHAETDAQQRALINSSICEAWHISNFELIERMAQEYQSTRARTNSGKWLLSVYYSALEQCLMIDWPDTLSYIPAGAPANNLIPDPKNYTLADERWDALLVSIDFWQKQYPKSSNSIIAKAIYYHNRAWFYRGGGYADKVPKDAWPLYKKYLESDRATLEYNRELGETNPLWFECMFQVATEQSWSAEDASTLIIEFDKRGQSYPGVYNTIFQHLMPRWGGSNEAMEAYAHSVVEKTRTEEGHAMYTRLYWNIADLYRLTFFAETAVNWPEMRQGFEEIIEKYPDPRNLNAYAQFACAAGDDVTSRKILAMLGKDANTSSWVFTTRPQYIRCTS